MINFMEVKHEQTWLHDVRYKAVRSKCRTSLIGDIWTKTLSAGKLHKHAFNFALEIMYLPMEVGMMSFSPPAICKYKENVNENLSQLTRRHCPHSLRCNETCVR